MTNTDITKIRLYRYKKISQELQELTKEVEAILKTVNNFDTLKAMEIKLRETQKTKQSHNDGVFKTMVEVTDDLEHLMIYSKNKINDLINTKIEIDEGLTQLNTNERMVIELRYFDCKKWEDINEILHIERRWMNELHKKALSKICKCLTS